MRSPYRRLEPEQGFWEDYFEDYALAFGLCSDPAEAFWMDPPEYEMAAKYADKYAKDRHRGWLAG